MRFRLRTRRRSAPRIRSLSVLCGLLVVGCALTRKASINTVDPKLQSAGEKLERAPHGGGYRLGRFLIERTALAETADPGGVAVGPGSEAAHPARRFMVQARLTERAANRTWTTQCVARREATIEADFAAVADESHDAVDIECQITGPERSWTFTAKGRLHRNFAGEILPLDETGGAPTLRVEILMWMKRLDLFDRQLPDPVAQVKRDDEAVAAMLLAYPQWAWLARDQPVEVVEVALVALISLDLLPVGLDG